MKKIIVLLCLIVLMLTLVSCSGDASSEDGAFANILNWSEISEWITNNGIPIFLEILMAIILIPLIIIVLAIYVAFQVLAIVVEFIIAVVVIIIAFVGSLISSFL